MIPHDHPEILAEDDLIRRISAQFVVEIEGNRRLSSMAFQPSSEPGGGMSVDIKKSIEQAGFEPDAFVTSAEWPSSVTFKADAARALGFLVGCDPLPENPHHGEVWGNFTTGRRKQLQRACTWFVPMQGVLVG